MKTRNYNVTLLGHEADIAGPATFADLAEIIGEDEARDTMVKSQIYRALAPRIRDAYFSAIEVGESARLGRDIRLKPLATDANGKATKWPKDSECQKQLAEQCGISEDAITVAFQGYMEQAVASVDFAEAVKKSVREGTLSKEWLGYGETVIAGVNEKRGGDYSVFLDKMRTLLPGASLPDEPTAEDVGRLLKRFNEAQKKAEFASSY